LSNIKLCVADNLVKITANKNRNYWSPLSCLVKEQEEEDAEQTVAKHLLSISSVKTRPKVKNKNNREMEAKNSKPHRHFGHGLHIGRQSRKGHGLFP
jgi:hypothetical protein